MSLTVAVDIARILTPVIGIVGFLFGLYKYVDVRDRELRWKRTEFLFQQAQYLDGDREINYAISVLAGTDEKTKIEDVFEENGDYTKTVEAKYRLGFDKLFNLLDRLAYARSESEVLDADELKNFGWYFHKVVNSSRTTKHCEINGYPDIIKVAQEI